MKVVRIERSLVGKQKGLRRVKQWRADKNLYIISKREPKFVHLEQEKAVMF